MEKLRPRELSYYYHNNDIVAWLKADPLEEEVDCNERQRLYMKYSVIKAKLDYLCPDNWDTKNFHQFIFIMPDTKKIKISGNIDVVVRYHFLLEDGETVREVYRTLAGAATFYADDYAPNEHWAATVKSLAIANAVQVLGPQFGWDLNPDEDEQTEQDTYSTGLPKTKGVNTRNGKVSILMKPDKEIRIKYAKAVAAKDTSEAARLESIYNFQ